MTPAESAAPCPCGSGYPYDACCGVVDRVAGKAFTISQDGAAILPAPPEPLRRAVENIASQPDLFPARIDFGQNHVLWIKMSPRWYGASVFLDANRIKGTCRLESSLDFLRQAGDRAPWRPTAFIFHTAFCGSTLMSQTLAAAYSCLPLREPDALGNLMYLLRSKTASDADKAAWLERVLRVLSRRFDNGAPVVIKANDYANAMLRDLLHARPDAPVLFMYTPLADFVAGCLKANNRKAWIRDRCGIVKTVGRDVLPLPGELRISEADYPLMAAVYWSYNIAAYLQALADNGARLRALEFSDMLAAPETTIAATARYFGLQPAAETTLADAIQAQFGKYSKNTEYRYSPRQRENELARLRGSFAAEIAAAEQLARRLLAERYPAGRLPNELA
jgi:hypothetical protein